MKQAKILKSNADNVVIIYWDGESGIGTQAVSISVYDLPDIANNDSVFEIDDSVIGSGIPYGITAQQLMEILPVDYILRQLHARNIWTSDDIRDNSSVVERIVASAIHNMFKES